jgi:hypothetical protein
MRPLAVMPSNHLTCHLWRYTQPEKPSAPGDAFEASFIAYRDFIRECPRWQQYGT